MFALLAAEILFNDEDAKLVLGAQNGNQDCFNQLVKKYEKLVYNTAFQYVKSADDAFDISQNTFMKAYIKLNSFRGSSKFSTWLYRIAQNCSKDYIRYRNNHITSSITVEDDESDEESQLDIPDTDINNLPEESLERNEINRSVRAAIDSLPEEQREIIILRDIDGVSYEDIAAMLDLELGTVKSRINRARKKIKDYLEERNFF